MILNYVVHYILCLLLYLQDKESGEAAHFCV